MEFDEVIKKRRAVRKYEDKEVSNEVIEKLIDAARLAPSGMNSQPWRFLVVKDKDKLKKIRKLYTDSRKKLGVYAQDTSFIENIAMIIVLFDKKNKYGKNDCLLAIENILLAATDLRLGSLCLGAMMTEEGVGGLRDVGKIPDDLEIVLPVVVGYADEEVKMPDKKDVKDLLFYDEF